MLYPTGRRPSPVQGARQPHEPLSPRRPAARHAPRRAAELCPAGCGAAAAPAPHCRQARLGRRSRSRPPLPSLLAVSAATSAYGVATARRPPRRRPDRPGFPSPALPGPGPGVKGSAAPGWRRCRSLYKRPAAAVSSSPFAARRCLLAHRCSLGPALPLARE